MKVIGSLDEAEALVGQELGVSDWLEVDQDRINAFADVTGDHQWIHVDVDKAKAESPFGATIAHGFLTLSLISALSRDNFTLAGAKMAINYGLNRVRFLTPVTVGSRVRVRSEMLEVTQVDNTTSNLVVRHTIDIDGAPKPAVVAEMIVRATF